MINGVVLFERAGGATEALKGIVNTVAVLSTDDTRTRQLLLRSPGNGNLPEGTPVASEFGDLLDGTFSACNIDILHGSLPTEAEYARILKRQLAEYRRKSDGVGGRNGSGREVSGKGANQGLHEQIYELAKEVKPQFLFFELRAGEFKNSNFHVDVEDPIFVRGKLLGDNTLVGFVADLTQLGYDCRWNPLSAYDVGSPQKRERVYLLARKREGVDGHGSKDNWTTEPHRGFETAGEFGIKPVIAGLVKRTSTRMAEVLAGVDEVCAPQYREAFLRLMGITKGPTP